jgi:hypothetical protein
MRENYFLAENENPNRWTMKISITFTVDTKDGHRRLTSAHAHLSEKKQKSDQ